MTTPVPRKHSPTPLRGLLAALLFDLVVFPGARHMLGLGVAMVVAVAAGMLLTVAVLSLASARK